VRHLDPEAAISALLGPLEWVREAALLKAQVTVTEASLDTVVFPAGDPPVSAMAGASPESVELLPRMKPTIPGAITDVLLIAATGETLLVMASGLVARVPSRGPRLAARDSSCLTHPS
jgi:hypothetical protein